MTLRIYNTLTNKKEEFKPLNYPYVNMYACGVTVYDDCHIGHGRSIYIFEIVRKLLLYKGYRVKFVRNITDIDDKIIKKAMEFSRQNSVPLDDAFGKVRTRYIESYYNDLDALGIPKADIEPLATENIPQMIDFIKMLIEKDFAYQRDSSVYFRIRKFNDYGKLSGRKIDDLFSGVRIEPDPLKEDPLDFALWKGKKENEPSWSSPFGKGRPGWHIECSVMANKFLGKTLDIHGGGKDLVFPHHENEIAQSEALFGKQFARFWMHHGLLTMEGQKMSKSLGNFITLKDAINKYSSSILKIVYLSSHYRSPLDFSQSKVQEAERIKERIVTFIKQLDSRSKEKSISDYRNINEETFSCREIKELYNKFIGFMNDDFNMTGGFSVIFDTIRFTNNNLEKEKNFFYEIRTFIYFILSLFSLEDMFIPLDKTPPLKGIGGSIPLDKTPPLKGIGGSIPVDNSLRELREVINEPVAFFETNEYYIEEEIARRAKLRRERKFKEADDIRVKLQEKGIILEDQHGGKTIWYKK